METKLVSPRAARLAVQKPPVQKKPAPRFEIYHTLPALPPGNGAKPKKQYRWRLVASNGEIIASGESHTRLQDAIRAIETVRACSRIAEPGPYEYIKE